jgi:hypothetical protein
MPKDSSNITLKITGTLSSELIAERSSSVQERELVLNHIISTNAPIQL